MVLLKAAWVLLLLLLLRCAPGPAFWCFEHC
jgi:hypothetical protein